MDINEKSNVLVVGAGGIGCELLKNLVMWKFKKITVIDLDTIDVSNLNRQFLFRKENVGKSKALVAKESVLKFNPTVEIDAKHDDIMKYDQEFFRSFDVVLSALDNRTARNHVNRMCLGAGVPLIEAGTMGYNGQVQLILKGKTACYECYPKPAQKQYPACTIRNTPSEPVHCIIWAKYLFNQLFGEPDADQDVVPDQNDPELTEETETETEPGTITVAKEEGNNNKDETETKVAAKKVHIRSAWKVADRFDPSILLRILFCDSILDLLSMKVLWTKNNRVPPEVLSDDLVDARYTGDDDNDNIANLLSHVTGGVKEQEHLTLFNWCQIFKRSALKLASQMEDAPDSILNWDKDDVVAMDFVAAASNIRMSVFHILPMLNRFEIKSIAGNIIPAIATTNALIAGVSVLHANKVLRGQSEKCLDVMVSDFVSARGRIVQAVPPLPPVNDCYVCSSEIALTIGCRQVQAITVRDLKREIMETRLKMLAPNVSVQNKSTIIIDGDADYDQEEVDDENGYYGKTLDQFDIGHGTVLRCSDFLREDYEFNVEIQVGRDFEEPFEIIGDIEGLVGRAKKEDGARGMEQSEDEQEDQEEQRNEIRTGGTSLEKVSDIDSIQEGGKQMVSRKRKHEENNEENEIAGKISRIDDENNVLVKHVEEEDEDDDDLIIMD